VAGLNPARPGSGLTWIWTTAIEGIRGRRPLGDPFSPNQRTFGPFFQRIIDAGIIAPPVTPAPTMPPPTTAPPGNLPVPQPQPQPQPQPSPQPSPSPSPLTRANLNPLSLAQTQADECECRDPDEREPNPSNVVAQVKNFARRMSQNSIDNLRKGKLP